MILRRLLCAFMFFPAVAQAASAITWKMNVISKDPKAPQNILWSDLQPIKEPAETLLIKGTSKQPETLLIKEGAGKTEKLNLDPVGNFQFELQLTKPITPFRILSILSSGETVAQDYILTKEATPGQYAKIIRVPKAQQIEGLTLKGEKLKLETVLPRPEGHMLIIEVVLPGKNRKLSLNGKPVFVSETGDAILLVELGQKEIQVTATDESGQSMSEAIRIEYVSRPLKPWSIGLLTGVMMNKYTQQGPNPFTVEQMLLGVGGEFHYNLVPETWFIHSSILMTPVSLSNKSSYKLNFLDIEGTLAYQLNVLPPEWKLELAVGGVFLTTSSSDANLGYQNLMAPQFYPVIRRSIGTGHEISGFFRMVPVGAGNVPSLTERVMTLGVDYRMKFGNDYEFIAGLQLTDLNYKPSENTTIESKSTILKAGFGF